MTVKLQFVLAPQVSEAVTITVVVPTGKVLPLGGLAITFGVLQPPLAETLKKTVAPAALVAATVMLEEQLSVMGVARTQMPPLTDNCEVSHVKPEPRGGRVIEETEFEILPAVWKGVKQSPACRLAPIFEIVIEPPKLTEVIPVNRSLLVAAPRLILMIVLPASVKLPLMVRMLILPPLPGASVPPDETDTDRPILPDPASVPPEAMVTFPPVPREPLTCNVPPLTRVVPV